MAVILVADRKLVLTGGPSQPDHPVTVAVGLFDERRIGPFGSGKSRRHNTKTRVRHDRIND